MESGEEHVQMGGRMERGDGKGVEGGEEHVHKEVRVERGGGMGKRVGGGWGG